MEEKVIGLRQKHLYIHEGFTLKNCPTFRIMRPLFQSEVDKRLERSSIMEYAWKTAWPSERAKYTIEQYTSKLREMALTEGKRFPGDDCSSRERTEKLIRSLPEDFKNLIQDYFDMDFDEGQKSGHTNQFVTWMVVPFAGSVLSPDMDWDVLFDLDFWQALNDPERIKEMLMDTPALSQE